MQGRRRAVQAGHDLGRAGGNRLKRLCEAGQVGRQRTHAHHRTARSRRALAVVVMGRGRVLRGGLMMRMHPCVVMRGVLLMRRVAMHMARLYLMARLHLMMRRHDVGEQDVVAKT